MGATLCLLSCVGCEDQRRETSISANNFNSSWLKEIQSVIEENEEDLRSFAEVIIEGRVSKVEGRVTYEIDALSEQVRCHVIAVRKDENNNVYFSCNSSSIFSNTGFVYVPTRRALLGDQMEPEMKALLRIKKSWMVYRAS